MGVEELLFTLREFITYQISWESKKLYKKLKIENRKNKKLNELKNLK